MTRTNLVAIICISLGFFFGNIKTSSASQILNLQCHSPSAWFYVSWWIDFDNKTITGETFNKQTNTVTGDVNTFPVAITPTYFDFFMKSANMRVTIDRTTGLSTWYYASGPANFSCLAGNSPLPTTRF